MISLRLTFYLDQIIGAGQPGVVESLIDNFDSCEYTRNSESKRYREPPTLPNRYSRRATELASPNDPRMGEIRRNSASEEKQQAILFRQRPKTVALCSKVEGGRIE